MTYEQRTIIALVIAIVVMTIAITGNLMCSAHGGEQMLCQLERQNDAVDWHYRTKVGGFERKCWYQGERMKPRHELYWAESPKIPSMSTTLPEPEPEFLLRWRGRPQGWDHQE
jgi:hypothetical protein